MKATEVQVTEIVAIKNSLIVQKSTILNKTNDFINQQQQQQELLSDEGDAASKDVCESITLRLHERDRSALYAIERALGKLAAGTYGQCESCQQEIGVKRLQVRPFTSLCIDCMEDQEDSQKSLQ